MEIHRLIWPAFLTLVLCGNAEAGEEHQHVGSTAETLGQLHFPTSCSDGVKERFEQAVAALHSFWYSRSAQEFGAIAKTDPSCGMAYWGVAMSHFHPLWEAPGPEDLEQGWAAVASAKSAGARTQRELDYIAAVAALYQDFDREDQRTRALAYERAMERLRAKYPKDSEAAIFYALAVLANAPADDKSYAKQREAGAILETIFAEQPGHPGVAHYIIHCYDYPPLAERALDAARRYATIAPESPHALHMPSHIFTRLGLWDESIRSNVASAAAAQRYESSGDQLHAQDYLVYAYLQVAQDSEASKVLKAMPSPRPDDPALFAAYYALSTAPARFAAERHRWSEAATLSLPEDRRPTARYMWAGASIPFARALGAARSGDALAAQKAIAELANLADMLERANEKYWAEQVHVQRETAAAWLTLLQGKPQDAVSQMRAASDHEDATEKHPVTPGVILPARELLGEMLLELKEPGPALAEFEAVLRTAPNRYNSLAGAARAAQLSGNREKARDLYARLLANCESSDGDRPELALARAFVQSQGR